MEEEHMTNEEAIPMLGSCRDYLIAGNPIWAVEPVEEAFDLAISAIEHDRWISVEERLPTIASTIIVAGKMKYRFEEEYTTFVDVATYTLEECFETFNDWYEGQDEFCITHWMPLPEPPKEET